MSHTDGVTLKGHINSLYTAYPQHEFTLVLGGILSCSFWQTWLSDKTSNLDTSGCCLGSSRWKNNCCIDMFIKSSQWFSPLPSMMTSQTSVWWNVSVYQFIPLTTGPQYHAPIPPYFPPLFPLIGWIKWLDTCIKHSQASWTKPVIKLVEITMYLV